MPIRGKFASIGRGRSSILCVLVLCARCPDIAAQPAAVGAPRRSLESNLYDRMALPEAWKAKFWASAAAQALFAMEPKAIADLVPVQSGVRFCRCPACDADELDDPLIWSPAKPAILTCRRCGATLPDDKYPAKEKDKKTPPEETIEVLPGTIHHYPYHAVEATRARVPDERLYLTAKRDYQARLFLTKSALYAAVKYHEQPRADRDPKLALIASVIILRFAQVYPTYATHLDQPGGPKQFQVANLTPPYRNGYQTGKWEWNGSLDVPMNLLLGYALVRDDPAMAAAGKLLGDPNPWRTVEQDLFRASAEFVRRQPEEYNEDSLHVYRGMLAVGKLTGDASLVSDALERLDAFAERGFYYDGMWRQAGFRSHRRVLRVLDGWIDRLLESPAEPIADGDAHFRVARSGDDRLLRAMPILGLAREAGAAVLGRLDEREVQRVSWPATPPMPDRPRGPRLLGGAGIARLAVGNGGDSLDLELRGLDSFGEPHFQRLALRLSIGGSPVLDDLDGLPPTSSGWDLATASHNTVVVDGLNQREDPARAARPAAGSDVLFHAADPDFQVTCFQDASAYPRSVTRYRHTLIASSGGRSRFALSIFEVHGGLQHDQLFHGAIGSAERWATAIPTSPAAAPLLAPPVPFLKHARADQGRWFVQSYGFFNPIRQGTVARPGQVWLEPGRTRQDGRPGSRLKLHLLGDFPLMLITASSPSPDTGPAAVGGAAPAPSDKDRPDRPSLILRRRSEDGSTLRSTFVTLFEPTAAPFPPILRAGRVESARDTLVIYVETAGGPEQIVVNLVPGTTREITLIDGQVLTTDGFVVRVRRDGLVLAGGTFAEGLGFKVAQTRLAGTIVTTGQQVSPRGLGWFETLTPLNTAEPLGGRILQITHGDGSTHSWTLRAIETDKSKSRLYVQEEPGFRIDSRTGVASYYQFPRNQVPGPHRFRISRMSR
jgi:hypothetical protein